MTRLLGFQAGSTGASSANFTSAAGTIAITQSGSQVNLDLTTMPIVSLLGNPSNSFPMPPIAIQSPGAGYVMANIVGGIGWQNMIEDSTGQVAFNIPSHSLCGPGGGSVFLGNDTNVGGVPTIRFMGTLLYNSSAQLWYDSNGVVSWDIANRLGEDTSAITYIDGLNRTLNDTAGNPEITFGSTSGPTINKKIVSYNGAMTAGNGTEAVLAFVNLTAQSNSIGTTTILTPGSAGQIYQANLYLVATTAGTSGTVQATLGWNDGVAARTQSSPTITFGTLAAPAVLTQVILSSTTAITYSTTVTSAIGSPVYELKIVLTRLV